VTGLSLDQSSYRALVTIRIRDDLALPADSAAAVSSSALGDVFLTLTPGHQAGTIPAGGMIGPPPKPLGRG
jgi:ABC-type transporter Mla subunit MlaD